MKEADTGGEDTLRRFLSATGAASALEPPPSLVDRAAQRLPQAPPRAAYRAERSRQAAGTILYSSSLLAVVVLAALSGWGAMGGVPQLSLRSPEVASLAQAALLPPLGALPLAHMVVRATLAALLGIGLLLPCALALGRWPMRTGAAAWTLARRPLRSLALGLPVAAALALLLPLAAMLGVTLVGLPLAALLAALGVVPLALGLAVVARAAGARVEGWHVLGAEAGWATAAVVALIVLALALLTLAVPPAALVLFAALAAPGLGSIIISRMGTHLGEMAR